MKPVLTEEITNDKIRNKTQVLNEKLWYSSLLEDTAISTTKYIYKTYPQATFKVLEQKTTSAEIFRRIAFLINDTPICIATNRLQRNAVVDDWTLNNSDQPFGRIFENRNLHREFISRNENSRKYVVTGEIDAQIEEVFYDVPNGLS